MVKLKRYITKDKAKQEAIVGASVVLLDYKERGVIISFKNGVYSIELEGGLVIEAQQSEFVVVNEDNYNILDRSKGIEYKDTNMSKRASKSCSSKRIVIDLHIDKIPGGLKVQPNERLSFQLNYFNKELTKRINNKGQRIEFIHGLGEGILRSNIIELLKNRYPLRCTYNSSDFAVTIVTIS